MNLPPDQLSRCDLTAHLPSLKSSLTPGAAEYSGIGTTLHASRKAVTRKAAEEFSMMSVGAMLAWILGFISILATCLLLWGRQP